MLRHIELLFLSNDLSSAHTITSNEISFHLELNKRLLPYCTVRNRLHLMTITSHHIGEGREEKGG